MCVTLLPAQHCPGSVMFLLQSEDKNILYTGDFRISSSRFDKYTILTSITIHEVYLDSTFLSEDYTYFPTQVESVREICNVINRWLIKNRDNKVFIKAPAQYSLEFLLLNIAKKCNERVFVPEQQQLKYVHIPALDHAISQNEPNSRIFLQLNERFKTVKADKNTMILKPTALFWRNLKKGECFTQVDLKRNVTRIAYSSHSSFEELQEFLQFLKPLEVFLNVSNASTIKAFNKSWRTNCDKKENNESFYNVEQFNKRLNEILLNSDSKMLPKRQKL